MQLGDFYWGIANETSAVLSGAEFRGGACGHHEADLELIKYDPPSHKVLVDGVVT